MATWNVLDEEEEAVRVTLPAPGTEPCKHSCAGVGSGR